MNSIVPDHKKYMNSIVTLLRRVTRSIAMDVNVGGI